MEDLDLPGSLKVEVHRAEKLANVQKLNAVFGKQDPYVTACLVNKEDAELEYEQTKRRDQSFRSATKQAAATLLQYTRKFLIAEDSWERTNAIAHGGTNPEWIPGDFDAAGNNNCMWFKHGGRSKEKRAPVRLFLRVMDQEKVGMDREIGVSIVDVEAALKGEQPLSCKLDDDRGIVWLSLTFDKWPVSSQNGILQIRQLQAKNLSKRVSTKLRNPSVVAEFFPWNLRCQTLALKNVADQANYTWTDTLSLHYAGLQGKSAAEQNLGLGLRLRLYGTAYFKKVGKTKCLGEAWMNPLPIVEAALKVGEESSEASTLTETISLFDSRFGITRCGELSFKATFIPQFDTDAPKKSILDYSSARKRALLIGINYTGKESPLRGCHNDVYTIQELLQEAYGCTSFMVLLDANNAMQPTAANIRKGLKWLIEESKAGEKLFLHYSGHGSQVPDLNGDEEDGKDETLVPIDFDWEHPETHITDDELRKVFNKLPSGVELTVLFDCCHSGTLSDLKLVNIPSQQANQEIGTPEVDSEVRSRFLKPCKKALQKIAEIRKRRTSKNRGGTKDQEKKNSVTPMDAPATVDRSESSKSASLASITVISGCRDDQTAADACINSKFLGATTWSLVEIVSTSADDIALPDLLRGIRAKIQERGWKQIPQLSVQGGSEAGSKLWLEGWSTSAISRAVKNVEGEEERTEKVTEEHDQASRSVRQLGLAKTEAASGPEQSPSNIDKCAANNKLSKWNSERVQSALKGYRLVSKVKTGKLRDQAVVQNGKHHIIKLGEKRITVRPTRKASQAKAV